MQTVFSSVLPDVPAAAVIWLVLLTVAAVAVGALVARPAWLRSAVAGRIRQAALPSHVELAEEERERARYAEEIAVAARRAGATAERCRAGWLTAQEEVEAAWTAYQAAEADVRRLSAAAAMPLPQTAQTPAEYADRERFLHRAALDAYWRKELSVEQLSDVFAHRNGWDPRRHPVEQELVLHRAIRDNLAARHRVAVEREREAWRAAELAAAASRSLRDEAFAALDRRPEETGSVVPMPETRRPTAEPTREPASTARGHAPAPAY
ncbi:hypothetical protein [Micromonospora coxensis]|uniref:AP2/ERF domain-containing protein n=1 Tax=Micromonospora coxensis TaxID=356852 RepID=A0A1C5J0Y5_9ACTN|nr:hypothetical protein [Micromonospora coxensis]SCG64268.1 hypothetical protein GA0070614_3778 [Micromonospora coxensis]